MRKILLGLVLLLSTQIWAQELPKNYTALLNEVEPQLISWRQHFHEFPELSNREFKTGSYIADYLLPCLTYCPVAIGLDHKYLLQSSSR